jgi:hypothetical protein
LAHAKEKSPIDKIAVFSLSENKLLQGKVKKGRKEKVRVEKILQILQKAYDTQRSKINFEF